jgi:hypothetical protein
MAESSRSRLREYQLGADGVERLRGELKEAVVKLWPAGREQDERYMAVNTLCNLALRLLHSESGQLGNIIDHWELVPNDIKSDPGMDNLNAAINAARQGTEGEVRSVSPVGLKPNAPAGAAPSRGDKPQPSPYSLGYNELAERVVELERELAFSNKRAENLLASLPVWRCREGQNPELLYSSYWFLKRSAKLTKPAQVGNTVFGVGVKERTVIERAQREHDYQQTPEREAARIDRGKTSMEAFQSHGGQRAPTPMPVSRYRAGDERLEPDPKGPWVAYGDYEALENLYIEQTGCCLAESATPLRRDVRAFVDAVVAMFEHHHGDMMRWPEWDAVSLSLRKLPESNVETVPSESNAIPPAASTRNTRA